MRSITPPSASTASSPATRARTVPWRSARAPPASRGHEPADGRAVARAEVDAGVEARPRRACACSAASVTPAPTSTWSDAAVDLAQRVRAASARRATSPPRGTPAPTSPVLPPCGTTAAPCSAQARSTAATSAVSAGRTTARARPPKRPVQSRLVARPGVVVGQHVGVADGGAERRSIEHRARMLSEPRMAQRDGLHARGDAGQVRPGRRRRRRLGARAARRDPRAAGHRSRRRGDRASRPRARARSRPRASRSWSTTARASSRRSTRSRTAADFALRRRASTASSRSAAAPAIDTAKVADLIVTHPAPVMDYVNPPVGEGRKPPAPLKPHLAIPTTSGTGARRPPSPCSTSPT